MAKIYWLASYPKSGNTWMRAILSNYLRSPSHPVDINELEGRLVASARELFDELVGVEASDLTADEIECLRPYIYKDVAAYNKETLYIKTHDAYTYTPEGIQLLPKDVTDGAIYIIRNPLDVAVSFAHHSNFSIKQIITALNDPNFALADNPLKMETQLIQKLLTWSGHVLSWVDEPGINTLVVRYEDMHSQPEETFGNVIRFAGLQPDASRLRKAIHFSSFEVVQAQEKEHGFNERMPSSESFFRKGQIGTWREQLNEQQAAQIVSAHGDVMRRFGYLTEDGKIVF